MSKKKEDDYLKHQEELELVVLKKIVQHCDNCPTLVVISCLRSKGGDGLHEIREGCRLIKSSQDRLFILFLGQNNIVENGQQGDWV